MDGRDGAGGSADSDYSAQRSDQCHRDDNFRNTGGIIEHSQYDGTDGRYPVFFTDVDAERFNRCDARRCGHSGRRGCNAGCEKYDQRCGG